MNEPLVSVVIPTYHRSKRLKTCINSVTNQTYRNIEIIVVDDNEPDSNERMDTEFVMESYKKNKNVKYIKNERNSGGSQSRNNGLQVATGEYITFLDDDDTIESDKIMMQVKKLETLDSTWSCCYTGYKVLKDSKHIQFSYEKSEGHCYEAALMRTLYLGSGSNLMVRTVNARMINGYDSSFIRNQDIEFLARLLENSKIAYVDKYLLTVDQAGERKHYSYDEVQQYTKFYYDKFRDRIQSVGYKSQRRIQEVITMDLVRYAIYDKEFNKAIVLLKYSKVRKKTIFKYIVYILKRIITNRSYGFKG